MPVDPTGTQPGLATKEPETPKTVHLRCKHPGCDSIEAVEITGPNSQGRHLYRCVKCNHPWGIATGGTFDI
jgi:transposase-like protein